MNYNSSPLQIKIDPVQFEQIIMNLVVNAKDAIDKENGIIKVKTYAKTVEKDIMAIDGIIKQGEYIILEISDNGVGIPEENLEKIFEPFFTTKKKDKGTGLGLSSVFGIIKQNKGYIKVESTPGKGSTFSVFFPRYKHDKSKGKIKKKHLKILFVDDEKDILDFIKEILADKGYTVLAFESPIKAIEYYKNLKENIDLVITDYTMPEMNGSELIVALKKIRDDFKTIFITGYADTEFFQNHTDQNIWVLPKPFTPRELLDFIDNIH